MKTQRGIALIQVLLVSGIIGLLMLQMGLTAREQVARAKLIGDRAELQLAAQSRESALIFSLLTEPMARKPDSENPYAAAWNFHGEPFTVDGITFSIQDESGRMRVPEQGGAEFEGLLRKLGVEAPRARRIRSELLELQGASPGKRQLGETEATGNPGESARYPLQDLGQLRLLPSMDDALYRRLRPLLTLYPTPGFNPTTAAQELLGASMTDSQLTGVGDARSAGTLDALSLWKLTGTQSDEQTVLAPGPGLTVRLEMTLGEAHTERVTTFIVRPYQGEALAVWQRARDEDRDAG